MPEPAFTLRGSYLPARGCYRVVLHIEDKPPLSYYSYAKYFGGDKEAMADIREDVLAECKEHRISAEAAENAWTDLLARFESAHGAP